MSSPNERVAPQAFEDPKNNRTFWLYVVEYPKSLSYKVMNTKRAARNGLKWLLHKCNESFRKVVGKSSITTCIVLLLVLLVVLAIASVALAVPRAYPGPDPAPAPVAGPSPQWLYGAYPYGYYYG
ncbi:hypothetical protein NQ318_006025 [Aromia moschata]|uniref:Uncharacterized protein n=1 Tax=Aromia moschata TaxID=1265417 RepID=A0AAV8Z1Q5_9CUCU|nr:hypothetical protein NQ318_006025 [Aromia moschata]